VQKGALFIMYHFKKQNCVIKSKGRMWNINEFVRKQHIHIDIYMFGNWTYRFIFLIIYFVY
ncbi:hypothetical protein AAHB56_16805, partial [Bacillus thuringiensis]